jgi:hypothetical protein
MLPHHSPVTCHTRRLLLLAACLALAARVHAQVRSNPVHQDTGPLSDISTNAGAGSEPVHQHGRSVRDGSLGTLSGNAVRQSTTGSMLSGPVSDISVGPVTSGRPVSGGGAMRDASMGAVKKDDDSLLGERITQPLHDFRALQDQLRAIQPLTDDTEEPGEPVAATEGDAEETIEQDDAPVDDELPADDEDAEAAEPEAAEPDAAERASAAEEELPVPEAEAEGEPRPDDTAAAPPSSEDDPRDVEERTPTPAGH